jgi:membrane protein implicated in regulation of membrane protease activity
MNAALRYWMFQLPGFAGAGGVLYLAVGFEWIGTWAAVGGLAAWVVKDLLLYPLLKQSYAPPSAVRDACVGRAAVATEPLAPDGYVRLGHELWRARMADLNQTASAGAALEVVAREGLLLRVSAAKDSPPESAP